MKLSAGNKPIDNLLDGGFETDIITIIYGPGGSGKTNVCLNACLNVIANGKKAIYIDTEGGFSTERFSQLAGKEDLSKIFFFRPTSFSEQKKAFIQLSNLVDDKIGIIIVDSIAMLYRLEIGKTQNIYGINKELGHQISYLAKIARTKNIPVLVTNHVYSAMDDTERVIMVGGDLLKYQSKCLIELQKFHSSKRIAILRKHRSLPENKKEQFEITKKGIITLR